MERKELEYHTLLCNNGQKIKLAVPIRLPEQMKCSVDDAWATVFIKEMNVLAYALWMARAERAIESMRLWTLIADDVHRRGDSEKFKKAVKLSTSWKFAYSKCFNYAQRFKE